MKTKTYFLFIIIMMACLEDSKQERVLNEVLVTVKVNSKNPQDTLTMEQALKSYGATYKGETEKLKENPVGEKVLAGMNKQFLKGLDSLIKGAATRSPRTFLIGSLNIASALVSSFGLEGKIASVVMNILVKALSIYGDISSGGGLDPTELALKNFQISNLELDVAGAKEYFDNIINPIAVTDENGADGGKEGAIETNTLKYTKSEAKQVIRNAQEKLEVYGKLQFLIAKYCKNGASSDEMKQCLKTIKIYCTLSQTHTAFLQTSVKRIQDSDEIPEPKRVEFVRKIVRFIAKRNQRDNETLHFLTDPMKYFDKTEVMFELYTKQDDYGEIIDHLLALRVKNKTIFKEDTVVVCREKGLNGLCREVKPQLDSYNQMVTNVASPSKENSYKVVYSKPQFLDEWADTKSIFIPPKISVKLRDPANTYDKSIGSRSRGPFHGLAVYSSNYKLNLKEITVKLDQYEDRTSYVQICTQRSNKVNRWCDTVNDVKFSFGDFNGVNLGSHKLDSITVPEDFDAVLEANDKTIIPIYGPFVMKDLSVCKLTWKGLIVKRISLTGQNSDKKEDKEKTGEVNKGGEDQLMKVSVQREDLSAEEMVKQTVLRRGDTMVKVCTEKNLEGFCKQIVDSEFTRQAKVIPFPSFQFFRKGCNVPISSMKIPAGKKVTIVETYSYPATFKARFGPYVGPVTLNELHKESKYQFIIENTADEKTDENINTKENPDSANDESSENTPNGDDNASKESTKQKSKKEKKKADDKTSLPSNKSSSMKGDSKIGPTNDDSYADGKKKDTEPILYDILTNVGLAKERNDSMKTNPTANLTNGNGELLNYTQKRNESFSASNTTEAVLPNHVDISINPPEKKSHLNGAQTELLHLESLQGRIPSKRLNIPSKRRHNKIRRHH